MRKTFLFVIFGISLALAFGGYKAVSAATLSTQSIAAGEQKMVLPYPGGDNFNPFFGQDHAYSVTFRGNGQAVVFLRIAFSNNGDTPLKTLTLRFPKVEPEGLLAYQVFRDKTCLKYDTAYPVGSGSVPVYTGNSQFPCLNYAEPNYSDYYYGASTYKKAKTFYATDTLAIDLLEPVAPQKSGSVLVYFRAFGFAKKTVLGAYNYTFETLKVDDTIRNLRVGISPDSGLFMKGAQGNVDYFRESAPIMESSKMMAVGASFRNSSVDTAISNIGYGTVNKTASNLMPLDSYKVKGSYANSQLKLYAGVVLESIIIIALVLMVLGFGARKLFKMLTKTPATPSFLNASTSHTGVNLTISALVGFVSASIITTLIFLVYFVSRAISSWSYGGDAVSILPIFIVLLFIGLTGLFLIFPCIVVGVKRGLWWGLATFVFTLFWLFLAFVVFALIFVGFGTYNRSYPIQIMK